VTPGACRRVVFPARQEGKRLALRFAAEPFHQILNQRRQLAGHQDKVGVKTLGEIFPIDIFVLIAQFVAELQALN
jgi:hypothetical protein